MPPELDRNQFLNLGALVEGGLVLLAFGFGWVAGISPTARLDFNLPGLLLGLAGTLPLLAGFTLFRRSTWPPLVEIDRQLQETIVPLLARCRWYDLVLMGLLAGVSEELLFRGVLQPWMSRYGLAWGLVISNVIFGLAHMITPLYALLAGLAGVYFGLMSLVAWPGESPGLLAPIVAHAVYDWLAFVLLVRAWRKKHGTAGADEL